MIYDVNGEENEFPEFQFGSWQTIGYSDLTGKLIWKQAEISLIGESKVVTMADVAAKAGVTKTTVSYVLGRKAESMSISAETRKRVISIAKEIGYQTQYAARALATRRTETLGFILSDKLSQSTAEYICSFCIPSLERACKRRGYGLLVSTENLTDADSFVIPNHVGQRRVDGLIFIHSDQPEIVKKFVATGVPCVCLGDDVQIRSLVPTVDSDLVGGWLEAIRYGASLGHRRIELISPGEPRGISMADFERLTRLARENPTTSGCRIRMFGNLEDLEWEELERIPVIDRWLAMPAGERPTLLMGPENVLPQVLQEMYRRGLHCPRDLSLIATGNASPILYTSPPLTSVDVNGPGQIEIAVNLLIDHLQYNCPLTPADSRREIPCRLLIRESCAAPAEHLS